MPFKKGRIVEEATKEKLAERMRDTWVNLTDEEYYQRVDNIREGLKKVWANRTKEEKLAISRKKRETWKRKAEEARKAKAK
jgi:hypothetical protein